jgi:hypothetical protein
MSIATARRMSAFVEAAILWVVEGLSRPTSSFRMSGSNALGPGGMRVTVTTSWPYGVPSTMGHSIESFNDMASDYWQHNKRRMLPVQDWYGNYTAEPVTDPIGAHRVIRGGSWNDPAQRIRPPPIDPLRIWGTNWVRFLGSRTDT